ncbi:MAG: hypothetical protein OER22_10270 [Gammaproteobacteria bacterium]|nr:hypothetical protein [Gammaproteobacteria bacterium]MDH3410420.1 hypothetical protein [Gammaproteobacteria bacterium]MDH3552985.1 hypothetical protein [Gammaproteobacteria bacterium]
MTRSPLFYPMHRGDTDAGGAADLQTDIMRFMAILALCLVAIFALVQSIPLAPEPLTQSQAAAVPPPAREVTTELPDQQPVPATIEEKVRPVQLTRPQVAAISPPKPEFRPARPAAPAATAPTKQGFTLRFESDHVLTRLVAAGHVGVYAIGAGRAQRMTVSESRVSFWDASTPNAFHEMETMTVPRPVIDALARTGVDTNAIDWGVTLPAKLRQQLDSLLRENTGGALVIGADGKLRLEAS